MHIRILLILEAECMIITTFFTVYSGKIVGLLIDNTPATRITYTVDLFINLVMIREFVYGAALRLTRVWVARLSTAVRDRLCIRFCQWIVFGNVRPL